ncbi:hypothetical protein [Cellulomonas sp. SG140]|uniref:hypothetical protein n=1 Tax=Cellulomonas sp. SG140 TaxID=2976536 RepID=UPI0021E6F5C4|nr:hypothetical protein [Cellulomonas sp. SG140]
MTEQHRVPTVPKASAGLIGSGVFFTVVGFTNPLAGVVAAATVTSSSSYLSSGTSPVTAAMWVGYACVLLGASLLSAGAYRLAAHADRAAGVLFPAAPSASGDDDA